MKLFVGDSHARQFLVTLYGDFSVNYFSGASARGLGNVNSHMKVGEVVQDLFKITNVDLRVLMFGGVDVDFILYKKLIANPDLDVKMYLDNCASRYANFLETLPCNSDVLVLGAHLAPLDGDLFFENTCANAQLEPTDLQNIVSARCLNHKARNLNTVYFNNCLDGKIRGHKYLKFLRIDHDMFDGEVIDKKFLSGGDHHCKSSETLKLWSKHLEKYIPQFSRFAV